MAANINKDTTTQSPSYRSQQHDIAQSPTIQKSTKSQPQDFSLGSKKPSKQNKNAAPQGLAALGGFQAAQEAAKPKSIQDMKLSLISEVLNAPAIKQYKITKTDLAYIPAANIRKVKLSEFDPYLQSIEALYANYLKRHSEEKTSSEQSSVESLNQLGENIKDKVYAKERLKHIPSIFFETTFNLEDPRVFEKVCEGLDLSSSLTGEISSTSSIILHEKLSNYLDTVEVDLVGEISKRSTSFFVALSNLQTLNTEALKCIEQIKRLRKAIKVISDTQCRQGLELIRLRRRRENLAMLKQTIQMMSEVKAAQPTIQILLGQGDFVGALDLVKEAVSLLRGTGKIDNKKFGLGNHGDATCHLSS
jgi:vacuolar protein sorting-associated protein 54